MESWTVPRIEEFQELQRENAKLREELAEVKAIKADEDALWAEDHEALLEAARAHLQRSVELRESGPGEEDWDEFCTTEEALRAAIEGADKLSLRLDPERLAQRFHEAYERLAPSFGYKTREASAVPWADVPEQNRRLMIAVATEVAGDSWLQVVGRMSEDKP